MPEKAEALGILLVLLPGFAAAYLVQLLAARRKQSELDKVVEALLFSLVLYLFTLPFFDYALPIAWHPGDENILTHGRFLSYGRIYWRWHSSQWCWARSMLPASITTG